jgi:hypothetical protein
VLTHARRGDIDDVVATIDSDSSSGRQGPPLGESRVGQGGVCASPIPKIGQRHQEAVVEPNGHLVNPMPERTRRHTPIDIELLSDVAECLW